MSTDSSTATADAEEAAEERTRLPRVVVRMSDAMKAAVDAYCKEHDLVATALGRELLADRIGYDLSKDPDAPGVGTRTKYVDDASREAGKLRNRKKTALIRKALTSVHFGQLKKRPEQVKIAMATVEALSDEKVTIETLTSLEATLDAAIKAGK